MATAIRETSIVGTIKGATACVNDIPTILKKQPHCRRFSNKRKSETVFCINPQVGEESCDETCGKSDGPNSLNCVLKRMGVTVVNKKRGFSRTLSPSPGALFIEERAVVGGVFGEEPYGAMKVVRLSTVSSMSFVFCNSSTPASFKSLDLQSSPDGDGMGVRGENLHSIFACMTS